MPGRIILSSLLLAALFACSNLVAGERLPERWGAEEKRLQKEPHERFAQKADYAPGQIIVKFREGTDGRQIRNIEAKLNLEPIRMIYKPNVYLMKILDNSSVESVMRRLQNYEEVIYSEPNYIRSIE